MPAKPPNEPIRAPLPADLADVAFADINDCCLVACAGASWVYQAVKDRRFPEPVIREHRFTRWRRADLRQWAIDRAAQRGGST